jgi:hypothetical protein
MAVLPLLLHTASTDYGSSTVSQAEDNVNRALLHREEVLDRWLERVRIIAGCKLDVVTLDRTGKEDTEFHEG